MKITAENRYEWIERYLENDLSEEELTYFKETLASDEALRAELEEQQDAEAFITANLKLKREKYLQDFQQILTENPGLPDISEQEFVKDKNFFLGFKLYQWAAILVLLIVSTVAIYKLFIEPQPSLVVKPPVTPEDTTKIPREPPIPEKNPPTKDSSSSTPSKDRKTPPDDQPAKVQDPMLAGIKEYRLSQRLGVAGTSNPVAQQRFILVYKKSPSAQIEDESKIYYLFKPNDTLRLYGDIQIRDLELLYVEPELRYYLKKGNDTLGLTQRIRWRELNQ